MKSAGADLKPKTFKPISVDMPEIQANAYTLACQSQQGQPGGAPLALQAVRNVSLPPDLEAKIDYRDPDSVSEFIKMSARFVAFFEILNDIKNSDRQEKVLVFSICDALSRSSPS